MVFKLFLLLIFNCVCIGSENQSPSTKWRFTKRRCQNASFYQIVQDEKGYFEFYSISIGSKTVSFNMKYEKITNLINLYRCTVHLSEVNRNIVVTFIVQSIISLCGLLLQINKVWDVNKRFYLHYFELSIFYRLQKL